MAIGRLLIVLVGVALALPSCLFVKAPDQQPTVAVEAPLSPLPEVAMGEDLIRSQNGDMIALLPKDWMFLDVHDDVSDDLIAVAVNPEYTLSVVFSVFPHAASSAEAFDKEGLLGLARSAYQKHVRKAAGAISLTGTYTVTDLGTRSFGLYAFSNGSSTSRCAVFRSSTGHFYECAIVPLNISGRTIPSDREQQAVFMSVLATIQY